MNVIRSCRPFVALPFLLAPALAFASPAEPAAQAVLAAHDARIAATVRADVDALDAMMTDDLSYTHSGGSTETKSVFLAAVRSRKYVYHAIDVSRRRVRVWGDAAVVSGPAHLVIEPAGRPRSEVDLYFTELYVRRDGRWLMALWQATSLPSASQASAAPAPAAATPAEAPTPSRP